LAGTISANRYNTIKPFTDKVNSLLAQVGMPNAKLKIQLDKTALSIDGQDAILFLLDANKATVLSS
jgi:DNA repair protein RecN (Recombination protein N)